MSTTEELWILVDNLKRNIQQLQVENARQKANRNEVDSSKPLGEMLELKEELGKLH